VFVEYNGVLLEELAQCGAGRLNVILNRWREAQVASKCTGAISVDQNTMKSMVTLYPVLKEKIAAVENGCDVGAFEPWLSSPTARSPNNLVFVGGIHPWTRLDVVIEALTQASNARLTIVGDGAGVESLKGLAESRRVAGRIEFLGRRPHSDVPGILSRAGVGVALAATELEGGNPLKLSEYLAAGLVPLINAYPGLEWLEAKGLGFLMRGALSGESVATALLQLSQDEQFFTATEVARRHAHAKQYLSWERTADRVMQFIQLRMSLVGRRPETMETHTWTGF